MSRILAIITVCIATFTVSGWAGTVELPATGDAFVHETYPTSNYGSTTEIYWGRVSGDYIWSLIVFGGLSGYMGVTVNNATLGIFILGAPDHSDNYLRRVTESWEEGTVTWNTRPDNTSTGQLNLRPSTSWFEIEVTDMVQDWLDGMYPNYGFCFLRTDALGIMYSFCSREIPYTNERPKLTLEFPTAVESASLGAVKAAFR